MEDWCKDISKADAEKVRKFVAASVMHEKNTGVWRELTWKSATPKHRNEWCEVALAGFIAIGAIKRKKARK